MGKTKLNPFQSTRQALWESCEGRGQANSELVCVCECIHNFYLTVLNMPFGQGMAFPKAWSST